MFNKFFAPIAIVCTTQVSVSAYASSLPSQAEANRLLFPEATSFVQKGVILNAEQLDLVKELSGLRQRNKNLDLTYVQNGESFIGIVLIDEVIGKHEYIRYAAGIDKEGKVTGIEILDYRETHGGEVKQESWRKSFKGKKLGDPFKLDNDVPNITGATLSCRNLLDGVKRLLVVYQVLKNGKII